MESFLAEYQNDPVDPLADVGKRLDPLQLWTRLTSVERGIVPGGHSRVTAFVDVGSQSHVHWLVAAWGDDFTGSVIDYGRHHVGDDGAEAEVYGAVRSALDRICRKYPCEDGTEIDLGLVMVDIGWKQALVYRAIKECGQRGVMPGRGIAIQPGTDFLYPKGCGKKGSGLRVVQVKDPAFRSMRQTEYYSAMWKSFVFERLRSPMGARGRMAFFGADKRSHRELSLHLTAEYREPVLVKDGTVSVDVWHLQVGHDNHWWDCLVGAAVAARHLGCELQVGETPRQLSSAPVSFSAMLNARRR